MELLLFAVTMSTYVLNNRFKMGTMTQYNEFVIFASSCLQYCIVSMGIPEKS
jgi:hypothetical protein